MTWRVWKAQLLTGLHPRGNLWLHIFCRMSNLEEASIMKGPEPFSVPQVWTGTIPSISFIHFPIKLTDILISRTRTKLMNGQIHVAGDQWPVFLYANYTYDLEDPWNGLLWSSLLISVSLHNSIVILFNHHDQAFKHIFTSPSSVDQEPKATCSGNAHLHRMRSITKASIAYVATQVLLPHIVVPLTVLLQACFALTSAQVFSCTDLITNLEHFYTSILDLLGDPDEKDEVDQLLMWWNRYKVLF